MRLARAETRQKLSSNGVRSPADYIDATRVVFKTSYVARLESSPQNVSLEILQKMGEALDRSVPELVSEEGLIGTPDKTHKTFSEAMRH